MPLQGPAQQERTTTKRAVTTWCSIRCCADGQLMTKPHRPLQTGLLLIQSNLEWITVCSFLPLPSICRCGRVLRKRRQHLHTALAVMQMLSSSSVDVVQARRVPVCQLDGLVPCASMHGELDRFRDPASLHLHPCEVSTHGIAC